MNPKNYLTDGPEIYRRSFEIIRSEANLARFSSTEESIVVRMIHAVGMVGLEEHIKLSAQFGEIARRALGQGASICCDTQMVAAGITQQLLPANNRVVCTLRHPEVPTLAKKLSTTRTAAAVDLWQDELEGALVAIGNAPTALFHLLDRLEEPSFPRPAAIIGCPVGFVGAAESKEALWRTPPAPCMVVNGRLGGSAMTAAAVNALSLETRNG
ncbi:MAG: precorrin-8X methylmutase [Myxococcales bacterium]|nr:precorrin-8X methylmutase [Myxococcales bacterium]